MKILLDAHTIVWALYDKPQLSENAKVQLEDRSNLLLVSHATLWELLAKIGRGKLAIAGTSVHTTAEDIHRLGVEMLPVTEAHILAATSLPQHHSDPFDRMLVAQALAEDAAVLSADGVLAEYGVRVIWQ